MVSRVFSRFCHSSFGSKNRLASVRIKPSLGSSPDLDFLFVIKGSNINEMQLKPCRYPTCRTLIPMNQSNPYCTKHASFYHEWKPSPYRKTDYREYNRNRRDQGANAFYHSRQWTIISKQLRRQVFNTCQCCGRTRDGKSYLVVDHIIPLKIDHKDSLNPANLWVLCKECHYWKTKLEQKIYGTSLINNIDTSKQWSRIKIQNWILSRENKKIPPA